MSDPTEGIRRVMVAAINEEAAAIPKTEDPRAILSARYGQVWDTWELQRDFTVQSFAAPFVEVKRKSDGVVGLMLFSHHPRYYHSFEEA